MDDTINTIVTVGFSYSGALKRFKSELQKNKKMLEAKGYGIPVVNLDICGTDCCKTSFWFESNSDIEDAFGCKDKMEVISRSIIDDVLSLIPESRKNSLRSVDVKFNDKVNNPYKTSTYKFSWWSRTGDTLYTATEPVVSVHEKAERV